MTKKNLYIFGVIFALLSVLFGVSVKFVDVSEVNAVKGTVIGFSTVNFAVHDFTGVNMFLYDLTNIMGIVSIAFGLVFALFGLIALIKGKSFLKVPFFYYPLGSVYILLGILYAVFEKVAVNYRPIIMPGNNVPEASFPSSHTLLIITIIGTALVLLNKLIKKTKLKVFVNIFGAVYIAVAILGRLFCGAHWFTDILESILISLTIICLFAAIVKDKITN